MKIDRSIVDTQSTRRSTDRDGAARESAHAHTIGAAPSDLAPPAAISPPHTVTRTPRAGKRRKSSKNTPPNRRTTSGATQQGGHPKDENHSLPAAPKRRRANVDAPAKEETPGGAPTLAGHIDRDPLSSSAGKREVGPIDDSNTTSGAPDLATIVADIRETYGRRRTLHKAEKAMILTLKAKARSAAVRRLRDAGEALPRGKFPETTAADTALAESIFPEIVAARDGLALGRAASEKRLRSLAVMLPVWPAWAAGIKGFGPLSLAIVVGEAGDLGQWRTLGGLRKHLGLAVIDGRAQRRVRDAEQALRQGYNPERRSAIYTIGDSCCVKVDGPYRQVYRDRKAYEEALNAARPEAERLTKLHLHRRAQRFAEKKLIKHLWQAWRREARIAEGFDLGDHLDGLARVADSMAAAADAALPRPGQVFLDALRAAE